MVDPAPAFQFYPRDFVGDLDVAAQSLEEKGAYAVLLCYAWLKNGLPNDHAKLAKALGVKPARFAKLWVVVGEKFPEAHDGRLRNPRQEEERAKQEAHKAERSQSGRKGNAKRWSDARSAIAGESPSDSSAVASHRSSSSSSTAVPPNPPQGGDEAGAFWELWREANAAQHRPLPLTPTARDYDQCRTFVARYADADWRATILDVFLKTDYPDIAKKPRTLGFLLHWSSWIDEQLRAKGRRPKVVA